MTVREYAKKVGHNIAGKLTRHTEWEYDRQWDGSMKHSGKKSYSDEAGNVYHVSKNGGCCIVTVDGDII